MLNGNEFNLNNMAQRYKEEMMRLYKKSTAPQTSQQSRNASGQSGMTAQANMASQNMAVQGSQSRQQNMPSSQGNMQQGQMSHNMTMPRDAMGTPAGNVQGASYFAASQPGCDTGSIPTVPVPCECRFPSAESIIESIAGIPATPNIRPEDNPPPVYNGNDPVIQPRNAAPNNASINNMNSAVHPEMGGTFSQGDKTAYQRSEDTSLQGVMLNMSPQAAAYAVPSEAENEVEILPDFALPQDSSDAVPDTKGLTPSLNWINLTGDSSWGFLQFDIFTAGGAYPVPGALVVVKKKLTGGTGLVRLLFSDRSGRTPTIALPAPSASLSQNPMSTTRPFSEYTVTVRARGYYTLSDINIPIFAGVKTVQPIDLIPLPEYSGDSVIQPRSDSQNNMNDSDSVG